MGLFDSVNKSAPKPSGYSSDSNRTEEIVFEKLPESFEDFLSLPQARLATPFDTAALTVLAFCYYPDNPDLSLSIPCPVLRSGPRSPAPTPWAAAARRWAVLPWRR